jgi:hypothetical protein
MSAATAPSDDRVSRLLATGLITHVDPATGRHQTLFAHCPADGEPAAVRRVFRGAGGAIVQVVLRCPRCGGEFPAPPAVLGLR